jgi:paraquat-inducible protein B
MTELPSAPSDIDILKANLTSLVAKLSKLPLDEVASDLIGVLKSAEQTLKTADQTLQTIQGQVQPLADGVKGVTDRASQLLSNVDADLPQIVTGLNQVMKTASNALNQAEQTLRTAQNALVPTSPLYFEVNSTLREIRIAATSVRSLADFLERNPNSLITGKK